MSSLSNCPEAFREILQNLASDIAHYKPETPGDFFRLACKERNSLLYGIEIEFSECSGLCNAKSREEWEEDFSDNFFSWLMENIPGMTTQTARFFNNNLHGSIEDFIDQYTPWTYTDVIDRFIGDADNGEFLEVSGWSNKEEATSGIVREYVTDSPENFDDTLANVETLFDSAGDWTIPPNGSCHIHVSVPGMKHSLSEVSALHCCILHELSQFSDLFPSCLQERWEECENYFSFLASPGTKMSCVHSHRQGTLEFRLWGAAEDTEDVSMFLKISCAAFLLGNLRFYQGRYDSSLAVSSQATKRFRDRFRDAMLTGISLEECEIHNPPISANCPQIWDLIGNGVSRGVEYSSLEPYKADYFRSLETLAVWKKPSL